MSPYWLKQQNGHRILTLRVPKVRLRAKEQLAADAPDLNLPRAEAALARAQNRIKVANNS